LAHAYGAHAQPNEPVDAQEQSEMLVTVTTKYENAPGFVPYHPDPRLSEKAAKVQPLHDYFLASVAAIPCNFPHYNTYMPDRIFNRETETLKMLFPDGRDYGIALNHLIRHSRLSLNDNIQCPQLKVLLEQFKAVTNFPSEW